MILNDALSYITLELVRRSQNLAEDPRGENYHRLLDNLMASSTIWAKAKQVWGAWPETETLCGGTIHE